jgi:uncharacterized small protein (DUF1192 family)
MTSSDVDQINNELLVLANRLMLLAERLYHLGNTQGSERLRRSAEMLSVSAGHRHRASVNADRRTAKTILKVSQHITKPEQSVFEVRHNRETIAVIYPVEDEPAIKIVGGRSARVRREQEAAPTSLVIAFKDEGNNKARAKSGSVLSKNPVSMLSVAEIERRIAVLAKWRESATGDGERKTIDAELRKLTEIRDTKEE